MVRLGGGLGSIERYPYQRYKNLSSKGLSSGRVAGGPGSIYQCSLILRMSSSSSSLSSGDPSSTAGFHLNRQWSQKLHHGLKINVSLYQKSQSLSTSDWLCRIRRNPPESQASQTKPWLHPSQEHGIFQRSLPKIARPFSRLQAQS